MAEKQRELISRQLVETLDKDSLAEMSDNVWLKKEVWGETGLMGTRKEPGNKIRRPSLVPRPSCF